MSYAKLALVAAVPILTLLLIRQNLEVLNQKVQFKLNLLLFTLQSAPHSLWVILTFTLFIGVLATGLYSLVAVFKLKAANRQLQHDLDLLKSELHTIKPAHETAETHSAPAAPEA